MRYVRQCTHSCMLNSLRARALRENEMQAESSKAQSLIMPPPYDGGGDGGGGTREPRALLTCQLQRRSYRAPHILLK